MKHRSCTTCVLPQESAHFHCHALWPPSCSWIVNLSTGTSPIHNRRILFGKCVLSLPHLAATIVELHCEHSGTSLVHHPVLCIPTSTTSTMQWHTGAFLTRRTPCHATLSARFAYVADPMPYDPLWWKSCPLSVSIFLCLLCLVACWLHEYERAKLLLWHDRKLRANCWEFQIFQTTHRV